MICIDLVPTEICDWKCNYCVFPNINSPKRVTKDIIDKHYKYIKDIIDILRTNKISVQVYLQGGEVGELPKELIIYILNKFDEKLTISTNGLFMKKEYHKDPEIRPYIDQIFWHVSSDCQLKDIEEIRDDEINIVRGIVHQDRTKLYNFIFHNQNDMVIEYAEIENPLGVKSIIGNEIINRCREYHNEITIDLVNEKICLCIRNFKNINIPLSELNLRLLLKSFPRDIFVLPKIEESSCYSCCRLCVDRVEKHIVKDRLKIRKIL